MHWRSKGKHGRCGALPEGAWCLTRTFPRVSATRTRGHHVGIDPRGSAGSGVEVPSARPAWLAVVKEGVQSAALHAPRARFCTNVLLPMPRSWAGGRREPEEPPLLLLQRAALCDGARLHRQKALRWPELLQTEAARYPVLNTPQTLERLSPKCAFSLHKPAPFAPQLGGPGGCGACLPPWACIGGWEVLTGVQGAGDTEAILKVPHRSEPKGSCLSSP